MRRRELAYWWDLYWPVIVCCGIWLVGALIIFLLNGW